MAFSAACALLKVPVSGHLGSGTESRGTGLENVPWRLGYTLVLRTSLPVGPFLCES